MNKIKRSYHFKSEETREKVRQNGKKSLPYLIAYIKSEQNRENARIMGNRLVSKENGKIYGAKALTDTSRTEEGRERARRIGKKYGAINISNYNESEEGKENSLRLGKKYGPIYGPINIVKVREAQPTKSQLLLCKSLNDNGIYNKPEWHFRTIHRIGDIAIPTSKLIIEVDGNSHENKMFFNSLEEKQADDKLKEEQIKSLGWNIIRFKNEEIENNLDDVIIKVKKNL